MFGIGEIPYAITGDREDRNATQAGGSTTTGQIITNPYFP
jgi:hypothetical protein